jgi:hypothetical protein
VLPSSSAVQGSSGHTAAALLFHLPHSYERDLVVADQAVLVSCLGAVGYTVVCTVLCLLLWVHNLYLLVWAVYAVFAPSIVRRQWLSRGHVEQ